MRLTLRVTATLGLCAAALGMLALPANAATPTIPDEPFSDVSTPASNWITSGLNWTPCLTAATVSAPGSIPACPGGPLDPVGDGALRLTDSTVQGGIAILDTPIDTSLGLQIEFDFFQYNTGNPGDGMSFFLIDGAANPTTAGSYGGGMGYASYHAGPVAGLVGGYVGVAFDTYGAFANSAIGSGGVPILMPNSISVRGDEAHDYPLISAAYSAAPIAVPTATDRDDARRHVVVTISKLNVMSIDVDYGAGLVTEVSGLDLETVNGPGSLPASLKLGFAGSTGGAYSVHEIRNFEIQTLQPNLAVSVNTTAVDPDSREAVVGVTVVNTATTGATDGLITITSTLPAGVLPTAAAGTGWTCGIIAQTVTCTRPGTGADRLAAGESSPPVLIDVTVAASRSLPVSVSASVTVLDDSSAANDTASAQLTSAALAATGTQPAPLIVAASLALLAGLALLRRRRLV